MKKRLVQTLLALGVTGLVFPAAALAQPYLTINSSGGNSANISVTGVPYGQSIDLVYTLPGSSLPTVISNIGTAYNDNWNGTINLNEYGIINGSSVYVRAGGQQSNIITVGNNGGCTYNCGNPYNLSLSQTSVNLNVGQSQTVTAYTNGGSVYISSNSNSSAVSASVSGSQISLYGQNNGSSTVTICPSNYSYNYNQNCASIYVTVGGGYQGSNQVLIRDNYYSPQTITVPAGTTITWRNDGSLNHTVTFNSPYSDSDTIYPGGSYSKTFNTPGTYYFNCRFHSGMSGTVVVTSSGNNNGNVWFSPSNPTLYTGQSLAVSINSSAYNNQYSSGNYYYISSNTDSSVVTATISGTVLNLYGRNSGSSNITVCHSSLNYCGVLYATVNGSQNNGNITFGQNDVNLNINQSRYVSVYYNGSTISDIYVSSNSNTNAVSATISSGQVYLSGLNNGSSTITVCRSGYNSACGSLYVTVSGGSSGNITFNPSNPNLTYGQSMNVYIYGGNGSNNYYVSSNSNSDVVTASVSGNSLYLYGRNNGSANISVCQNNGYSSCGTLYVTVGSGSGSGNLFFQNTTLPTMTVGQYYSYQLQVSGGNSPYNFNITSGSLPAGLYLSNSGLISGTPQNASSASFTVRVNDNYGRSATSNFYISGNGGVAGASTYKNGQLIKEGNTVYIVYKNTKSGFANEWAFTGFGFSWSNVWDVGSSGLTYSGYTITTANASHPWGSWIKNGQTVYFVHESGLVPAPDWNTFLNNNGDSRLIVNANSYDMRLPILSPMTYGDYRLQ